jgi:hypothetical protein
MDQGMMERWRVTAKEFNDALAHNPTDEQLYAWFMERVRPDDVRTANEWLLHERTENLDRQDSEEVAVAERR